MTEIVLALALAALGGGLIVDFFARRRLAQAIDQTRRDTERSTRRRLVSKLRAYSTSLILLDHVLVTDLTVDGNLMVLGDHSVVTHSIFTTPPTRQIAVEVAS